MATKPSPNPHRIIPVEHKMPGTCHFLHLEHLLITLRGYCCCLVAKSCLTLVIPWTAAYQAPRPWNLPRILESESEHVGHSVLSDSFRPHGLEPNKLLCPWNSPGKNTRVSCHFPSPEDLPDSGIEPESLALAGRFFTTKSPGKPQFYAGGTVVIIPILQIRKLRPRAA